MTFRTCTKIKGFKKLSEKLTTSPVLCFMIYEAVKQIHVLDIHREFRTYYNHMFKWGNKIRRVGNTRNLNFMNSSTIHEHFLVLSPKALLLV